MELLYMNLAALPRAVRCAERYVNGEHVIMQAWQKGNRLLLRFTDHADLWLRTDGQWAFVKKVRNVQRHRRKRQAG